MIKHIPFNKARQSVPYETLYLEYWQKYASTVVDVMGEEKTNFDWIMSRNPHIVCKKRAAMVAASFIVFMGCNAGRDFTARAEDFYRVCNGALSREDAYVARWALHNKRSMGVSNGEILMEVIVGRRVYNKKANYGSGAMVYANINRLTVEDTEILNEMVIWWSRGDAKMLREVCDPKAQEKVSEIMKKLF